MPVQVPPDLPGVSTEEWNQYRKLQQRQAAQGHGCNNQASASQCTIAVTTYEEVQGTCVMLNRIPTCVFREGGFGRKISSQLIPRHHSCMNMTMTPQNPYVHGRRNSIMSTNEMIRIASRIPVAAAGRTRITCTLEKEVQRRYRGVCRRIGPLRYGCVSSSPLFTVFGHRECRHIRPG
uniref:Uncharacterized protein n=1 Tax=Ciona savignyi TaxID=51511 RepID=H2YVZ2_CIOSA